MCSKDADGVSKDKYGSTAWFINGDGNVEVYIGVHKNREPPYGSSFVIRFISINDMEMVREGLNRMNNKPIEINVIFYILFGMSFFIAVLVGAFCYRLGVMAEKISVLETQNPLPQEVLKWHGEDKL